LLVLKTKIVSCHTANSKPVKQEVNGTVILPPLVFPAWIFFQIQRQTGFEINPGVNAIKHFPLLLTEWQNKLKRFNLANILASGQAHKTSLA
jgi:hypothetical protein